MSKKYKLTSALLTLWGTESKSADEDLRHHLEVIINVVDKARAARPHTIPSYRG